MSLFRSPYWQIPLCAIGKSKETCNSCPTRFKVLVEPGSRALKSHEGFIRASIVCGMLVHLTWLRLGPLCLSPYIRLLPFGCRDPCRCGDPNSPKPT